MEQQSTMQDAATSEQTAVKFEFDTATFIPCAATFDVKLESLHTSVNIKDEPSLDEAAESEDEEHFVFVPCSSGVEAGSSVSTQDPLALDDAVDAREGFLEPGDVQVYTPVIPVPVELESVKKKMKTRSETLSTVEQIPVPVELESVKKKMKTRSETLSTVEQIAVPVELASVSEKKTKTLSERLSILKQIDENTNESKASLAQRLGISLKRLHFIIAERKKIEGFIQEHVTRTAQKMPQHKQKNYVQDFSKCSMNDAAWITAALEYKQQSLPKLFKCNICLKSYFNKGSLATHYNTHHSEKSATCCACKKVFVAQDSRRNELSCRGYYQDDGSKCVEVCDTQESLFAHVSTEHSPEEKGNFACLHCEESFHKKYFWNVHMREHKTYDCKVCDCKFSTNVLLRIHFYKTHPQNLIHFCTECDESFLSVTELNFHKERHELPIMCEDCETKAKSKDECKLVLLDPGGGRKCQMCDFFFSTASSYWQHVNGQILRCDICDALFCSTSLLVSHMSSVHGALSPLRCKNCLRVYPTQLELTVHEQSCWVAVVPLTFDNVCPPFYK